MLPLRLNRGNVKVALSIRTSSFPHDAFDVCHFMMKTQLVHFGGDKLEHFVKQLALVYLAATTEVDHFTVQAVT